MCTLEDFRHLSLTEKHRAWLESELELWHKHYLPIGPTVLDVGAGCGETALFYLNHGAKRIICIEGDGRALELLTRNFGRDERVTIVPTIVDSIKIDIEGSEKNARIETHFPVKFNRLARLAPNASLWTLEEAGHIPIQDKLYWSYRIGLIHKRKIGMAHIARRIIDALKHSPREAS